MTRATLLLLAGLLLGVGCEAKDDVARGHSDQEPFIDVPVIEQTVREEGKKGLVVEVTAPESIPGGQTFDVSVDAHDNAGEIRGVEIDFGDNQTWGGLPFDLVCGAEAGTTPTEGPDQQRPRVEHSYRKAGTYDITVSAYSGGCFVHYDRASVRTSVKVVSDATQSNGPRPPRAKIGHAYYVNDDPSVLVSDIGGYDDDGYVTEVVVDWGDGTDTEVLTRPLSKCSTDGGWPNGWFFDSLKHAYAEEGDYEVSVEVTSVGCDGMNEQADAVTRVLEFPPEQGS